MNFKIDSKPKELKDNVAVVTSVVKTITEGFVGGGNSKNARKRYLGSIMAIIEKKSKQKLDLIISFSKMIIYLNRE